MRIDDFSDEWWRKNTDDRENLLGTCFTFLRSLFEYRPKLVASEMNGYVCPDYSASSGVGRSNALLSTLQLYIRQAGSPDL